MAGSLLLNSSVQAKNRGPATLEPDPARLIRLGADTAATKANRKPAIVGTVRHKANARFWNSIEPPLPIDISRDRKSTRLNSSHVRISYAVFCLKKKNQTRSFLPGGCQAETRFYVLSAEREIT